MDDLFDEEELGFPKCDCCDKKPSKILPVIIIVAVLCLMIFGMCKLIEIGQESNKKVIAKQKDANEYVTKCIEDGKRAEDCKMLADVKFYGVY